MKVVQGHPDFIKTIEDGEEVEDFSEESDEEVEYQPSKQSQEKGGLQPQIPICFFSRRIQQESLG